jgi:hypothetical protein
VFWWFVFLKWALGSTQFSVQWQSWVFSGIKRPGRKADHLFILVYLLTFYLFIYLFSYSVAVHLLSYSSLLSPFVSTFQITSSFTPLVLNSAVCYTRWGFWVSWSVVTFASPCFISINIGVHVYCVYTQGVAVLENSRRTSELVWTLSPHPSEKMGVSHVLKWHAAFRKVCMLLDHSPLSIEVNCTANIVTCLCRNMDTQELAEKPYRMSWICHGTVYRNKRKCS